MEHNFDSRQPFAALGFTMRLQSYAFNKQSGTKSALVNTLLSLVKAINKQNWKARCFPADYCAGFSFSGASASVGLGLVGAGWCTMVLESVLTVRPAPLGTESSNPDTERLWSTTATRVTDPYVNYRCEQLNM